MSVLETFLPAYTQGQTVAPAAATASISIGFGSKTICLTNTGANICYVRTGTTPVVATAADYPVLAGQQVTIGKAQDHDTLAYISAAGTTLNAIPGEGF